MSGCWRSAPSDVEGDGDGIKRVRHRSGETGDGALTQPIGPASRPGGGRNCQWKTLEWARLVIVPVVKGDGARERAIATRLPPAV